jgi:hypothetical protein
MCAVPSGSSGSLCQPVSELADYVTRADYVTITPVLDGRPPTEGVNVASAPLDTMWAQKSLVRSRTTR